jgi:Family of unknown function (DUF6262)
MARTDIAEQRIAALKQARAEDSARKRRNVNDTIQRLTDNGTRVTFELVARQAGVSRQFLYGDKALRAAVEQARHQPPVPRSDPPTTEPDGLLTDLMLAREEIKRLRSDNTKLQAKLIERAATAVLDGEDEAVRGLTTRNVELVRETAELRRQLTATNEDLGAARATNRDLMTEINRH